MKTKQHVSTTYIGAELLHNIVNSDFVQCQMFYKARTKFRAADGRPAGARGCATDRMCHFGTAHTLRHHAQ